MSLIVDGQYVLDQSSDTTSSTTSTTSEASRVLEMLTPGNELPSPEGSECAIQTLYEGPAKCPCCINWVEEYPDDLRIEIQQQEQTKQKALVLRMRKNHREGKSLVLDSLLIQSQSLKNTLARVFEGYRGITPTLKKLVFRAPFHAFHFRWDALVKVLEDQKESDPEAVSYTQLLYDVLDAELRDSRDEIADLQENGVMTYNLLWSLFKPGERIISEIDSQLLFFITKESGFNEKGIFDVQAKFVDWDGTRFGYAPAILRINPFEGTKPITELEVYPASLHPSLEEIEAKAIARGERFRDLSGVHHMAYSGPVRYKDSWRRNSRSNVDGRVLIDAESYSTASSEPKRPLESLDSTALVPEIRIEDRKHGGGPYTRPGRAPMPHIHPMPMPIPSIPAMPIPSGRMQQVQLEPGQLNKSDNLTRSQLLLCTSQLLGYSLNLKSWVKLDIAHVKDINWNDEAFPNLMLPPKYKSLVLSFVEGHISHKHAFDDVIEGKGQGVVMLLEGNPGTGKTLTAEAVADRVKRPLYTLSVGELGRGEDVEERLENVLHLTEKWNAVLLFDECDVLLEERSSSRLEHNGIVAVFLRMLEYYRGIIIMTSNRAQTMDRAFQSRIHLTLRYPDLSQAAKEHIWRYFITKTNPEATITDESYSRLAQLPINGRQIKNVVKISMLLAAQEEEKISIDYIDTVLQATMELETDKS